MSDMKPIDYCSICRYWNADPRGRCERHGKPVEGVYHPSSESIISLASGEVDSALDCGCTATREDGKVLVFLCEGHLRAKGELEYLEGLIDDARIVADPEEGQSALEAKVRKLLEIDLEADRARETLRDFAPGVLDSATVEDLAISVTESLARSCDGEDLAEKLLALCGLDMHEWQAGLNSRWEARFNPIDFLVERLRALAPEKLATGAPLRAHSPRELADLQGFVLPAASDFVADLRQRVERLEGEVRELRAATNAPKRRRVNKGDAV